MFHIFYILFLFLPDYICSRDVEIGLSSIYLSYVAHTSYMWTNSKNRKRTRIVVGTCDTNRTRKATYISLLRYTEPGTRANPFRWADANGFAMTEGKSCGR